MGDQIDLNICRLCNENIGVKSLFDSKDAGIQLSAKVMHCAKVSIARGDGLPANICVYCEESLASTYRFVLKCEQTDQQLRSQLTLKPECEIKHDVKIETIDNTDDTFASDNNFEDICDSPPFDNIKVEISEIKIKRKKYARSNVGKKSKKVGPFKCKVCGRVCINQSTLVVHMRSHTNEKPHTCPSCDKSYKDSGTLKRHIERNHNDSRQKTVMCEHCGKGFYSKVDCKIHTRTHTGETPFACTECPARFTQIGSLRRHTLTHTGERSHMCSKCSKKFPTREQLKIHYLVHTDEKKHKCPICGVLFKYNTSKRKHMIMHTDGKIAKFTCNDCGRCYFSKGNLKIHIKRLHSSKSGYCSDCCKHVPNLEMHMWKHSGLRPIKCELCPSSFYELKGLSTHVNFRHKFPDKFKCTINDCTQKFPSQPMLDYHVMRYHKTFKPFSCDKCPRRFYRKSDMVRHKKGTHKEFTEFSDYKARRWFHNGEASHLDGMCEK